MKVFTNLHSLETPTDARYMLEDIVYYTKQQGIKKVCALFGLRRTGKTVLLQQTIANLLENGISQESICYVEGERGDQYDDLIDYLESHKASYIFIDEIGYFEGFLTYGKSLCDRFSAPYGIPVVIAGTHALAVHIAPKGVLFGRADIIEVPYLSYYEYLRFVRKSLPNNGNLISYMVEGGFFANEDERETYVTQSLIAPMLETINNEELHDWSSVTRGVNWEETIHGILLLSSSFISNKSISRSVSFSDELEYDIPQRVRQEFRDYFNLRKRASGFLLRDNEVYGILRFLTNVLVVFPAYNLEHLDEHPKCYVQIPFLRYQYAKRLADLLSVRPALSQRLLGALFEGLVLSEWKQAYRLKELYFLRGNVDDQFWEIDLIDNTNKMAIEVKSSVNAADAYKGFRKLHGHLLGFDTDVFVMERDCEKICNLGKSRYSSR